MILICCMHCFTAVRVLGHPEEVSALVGEQSEWWPDSYICISCGSVCQGYKESEVDTEVMIKLKIKDLSAIEMYAAQNGLGTPEEAQCHSSEVKKLLIEQPIVQVLGHNVPGTTRFCLTELVTKEGFRLYFGASPHGAIVYRIVRPHSYVQEEKANG